MSISKWPFDISNEILMISPCTFNCSSYLFNNSTVFSSAYIQSFSLYFPLLFLTLSQRHVLLSRVSAMQSVCPIMIPPLACVSVLVTVPMNHALYVAVMEKLTSTSVSWKLPHVIGKRTCPLFVRGIAVSCNLPFFYRLALNSFSLSS